MAVENYRIAGVCVGDSWWYGVCGRGVFYRSGVYCNKGGQFRRGGSCGIDVWTWLGETGD